MQSKFTVIADLGNFRFSVQCLGCGHDFFHRSGQENSFTIREGVTTPMCPICGAKDDDAPQDATEMTTDKAAFAAFGITLAENTEEGKEPWEIYDDKMRQALSRTADACAEQGKIWIEQDIRSNDYDGTLTQDQIAAIKHLFPTTRAELLAFCRAG